MSSASSATYICFGLGGGPYVCVGLGGRSAADRAAVVAAAEQLAAALGTDARFE